MLFGDEEEAGFGPMPIRVRMAGGPQAWLNVPSSEVVTEPVFPGPVPLVLGPSSWGFGIFSSGIAPGVGR